MVCLKKDSSLSWGVLEVLFVKVEKSPTSTSWRFALVMATFNRLASFKNPMLPLGLERVNGIITKSLSCP